MNEIERKATTIGMQKAFANELGIGLSKREWLAGMALQGLIACEIVRGNATELAQYAVEHADATLKQLAESDGAK